MTRSQAVGVIANEAEVLENQGRMVAEGTLQHLKFVLRSASVEVQREAARAMGNLAAEFSHTAELASGGAFPPLVATLRSPDALCQRYARARYGYAFPVCGTPMDICISRMPARRARVAHMYILGGHPIRHVHFPCAGTRRWASGTSRRTP